MADRLERRLVAVMFTDMVGFTALMQAGELNARDKRGRHIRPMDEQHDAFGGTIVQCLDDGTVSTFASSLDAADAAVKHPATARWSRRPGTHRDPRRRGDRRARRSCWCGVSRSSASGAAVTRLMVSPLAVLRKNR